MTKIKSFFKNYISIFAIVCFSLAIVSYIILSIGKANVEFANFIVNSVGRVIRVILNYTFWIFPFSIAEILLISVPLIVTVFIVTVVFRAKSKKPIIRFIVTLIAALTLFYSLYAVTLGIGYHQTPVATKLDMKATAPTEDELYDTLLIVKDEMEALLPEIQYQQGGSSQNPLNIRQMSKKLSEGYRKVAEKYPNLRLDTFSQRAKPVIMSKGMTYLEILGVYSYFTGESNVNVHVPDYTIPFTVAHEFAHTRGISREDEANFIAFLVCINTDDAYIKYSAYLNMYEYLISALGKTNKDKVREMYSITDMRIINEMRAYIKYYEENKSEFLGKLSDFVNDRYLKAQGTPGVVSYGLVVRLCVAYYRSN